MSSVLIIGAGASGLFAGIVAAGRGHKVMILEKNDRAGKKLLATGGGWCNFTNSHLNIDRYHGGNRKFVYSAISGFGTEKTIQFFERLGLPAVELSRGRLYPRVLQSKALLDCLLIELKRLGVEIKYGVDVKKLSRGVWFEVLDSGGELYHGDSVILATGGATHSDSGSDGSGYALVEEHGHVVTELFPGIVQMKLVERIHKSAVGVRFSAQLKLVTEDSMVSTCEDEVLFADYGISGPAVLQLSRTANRLLKSGKRAFFVLDLMHEKTEEELTKYLASRFSDTGHKTISESLIGLMNTKLITLFTKSAGFDPDALTSNVDTGTVARLSYELKNWKFEISGYKSFDSGQVTAGGIDTMGIDTTTMESKLVRGLYFTGEVMDIDGDCGGYNLQWAWSSAYSAAMSLK